jgi:hypothetical protein
MSTPATRQGARPQAPPSRLRASKLTDTVLIQCDPGDAASLISFLRPGGGLILTGGTQALHRHLISASTTPVLRDRKLYAGKNRKLAGDGVSERWLEEQWRAGATVALTDGGYLTAGDHAGLVTSLQAAVRASSLRPAGCELYAVLPVHQEWLRSGLPTLIREVNNHGVAVALVVENANDPFGVLLNVKGLVQLLRQANPPIVLLRSDLSAVGAIAFGATAGAVGTRTALRHLYPIKSGGGGFSSGVSSAIFNSGLAFVQVDKLAAGVAATPSDPMWLCACATCSGRRIDWLYGATGHQIAAHNVELTLDLRDHIVKSTNGASRAQSWRAMCRSAEFQYSAAAAIARVGWSVPNFLNWWQQV